ncbi:MAG: hypothetical protein J6Y68_00370 [Clostridia bacterium]|nr:hypothetical protein [Clostridia bacterium]
MVHGLADGIFWSGVFAFVSASINAIKTGVRSIKNAKIEGPSQSGSQPCCKIHGKAHGSAKHQARIMKESEMMQSSGKYSDIYLNKALKTVGLKGSQRPDIIGKMVNGTFDVIEVASKTQVSTSLLGRQLAKKVALMQANNPGVIFHPIIWLYG